MRIPPRPHTSWHFEHMYLQSQTMFRTISTMCISNANRNASTCKSCCGPRVGVRIRYNYSQASVVDLVATDLKLDHAISWGTNFAKGSSPPSLQQILRRTHDRNLSRNRCSRLSHPLMRCSGQRKQDHLREHYKGESHLFQKLWRVASIHELNIKV